MSNPAPLKKSLKIIERKLIISSTNNTKFFNKDKLFMLVPKKI